MKKTLINLVVAAIYISNSTNSQNQKQFIHRYTNNGEKKQKIIDNNGNIIDLDIQIPQAILSKTRELKTGLSL